MRRSLARDAFIRTADYDAVISAWMDEQIETVPTRLRINATLQQTLRYGENPNQGASIFRDINHVGPSVVSSEIVAGKPLSYNNLMDAAAALELVQDLHSATHKASAVIIKHANPCGAAIADTCTNRG